jgi:hypothetical protein
MLTHRSPDGAVPSSERIEDHLAKPLNVID